MITNHVINTESELTVEGYINLYKKIWTVRKAYLEVIDIVRFLELKPNAEILVAHANGLENAIKVQKTLQDVFPEKIINISELSPVISVHTGPNTVGIGWINK